MAHKAAAAFAITSESAFVPAILVEVFKGGWIFSSTFGTFPGHGWFS